FSQNAFAFLHFPKSCLKCASRGQCLAQFVTSRDAQKTKTRESAAQQLQVAGCRVSKTVCLSEPPKEIVQVPAHQFEAEHLVARYLCIHDSAHVCGVISSPIDPELRGIARFGLRQKKLLGHACSARVAQSVREQIASRTRNRANHITTPRMTQLMKQTSHLLYVEISYVQRVVFDELPSGLDDIAHQNREHFVGVDSVVLVQVNLQQFAFLGIHCGLKQLLGIHLTETLKTFDLHSATTNLQNLL